jgi:hypothetical protein
VAGLLRLEAREFRDRTRWRWVLTDASEAFVADHEVRLDPAEWQFEAFTDLPAYLRWHTAPDRRREDEARIVGEVGEWMGSQLLGPIACALARQARRQPVTVRVSVSADAAELLLWPLELAHIDRQAAVGARRDADHGRSRVYRPRASREATAGTRAVQPARRQAGAEPAA